MTARIIQWGTGNVGKHALRAIVEELTQAVLYGRKYREH